MPAIALVDRDGVYGAPRFHMAAKTVGIRAHVGAEISVEGFGNRAGLPPWMPNSTSSATGAVDLARGEPGWLPKPMPPHHAL